MVLVLTFFGGRGPPELLPLAELPLGPGAGADELVVVGDIGVGTGESSWPTNGSLLDEAVLVLVLEEGLFEGGREHWPYLLQ